MCSAVMSWVATRSRRVPASGGMLTQRLGRAWQRCGGRIDRVAQALYDGVDVALRGDKGRCQQHVVAVDAINCAAHRIDHQTACHALVLDARMELVLGVEGGL